MPLDKTTVNPKPAITHAFLFDYSEALSASDFTSHTYILTAYFHLFLGSATAIFPVTRYRFFRCCETCWWGRGNASIPLISRKTQNDRAEIQCAASSPSHPPRTFFLNSDGVSPTTCLNALEK
jgi:hypothetical protein